jgi:regulator of nucleoside diphosphate kinase
MIAKAIGSNHQSVITGPDFDRLNDLSQSQQYRTTHSALLADLKDELNHGKVVPSDSVPRGIITMNSQVRVRDLDTDERETYTLAYPGEADIQTGKLSVLAPLGIALLGARVGQTVKVHAPAGLRKLKVECILYQPEAAGDYHL